MPDVPANPNALDEWKEARSIISRFDENLHDVRKYGFTFLAALLTLDALQTLADTDVTIKIGLIGLTIAFIVALRLFEENYKKFQQAAALRAMILETTILNIELTEMISEKYRKEDINTLIYWLYVAFVIIAVLIGIIIVPFGIYWSIPIILGIIGIWLVRDIPDYLPVILEHPDNLYHPKSDGGKTVLSTDLPREDWTIDKVSCESGDKVKITFTNLSKSKTKIFDPAVFLPIKDLKNPVLTLPYAFCIKEEGESEDAIPVYIHPVDITTEIPGFGNCSWLWDTSNTATANHIYRVWPRGWTAPLKRSIVVNGPSAGAKKGPCPEIDIVVRPRQP